MPGDPQVRIECLPNSSFLGAARTGHDVTEIGEGQRILATPIEERLTLTSCGVLELLTEGSTKPVAQVRTHAGIARVMRYTFTLT